MHSLFVVSKSPTSTSIHPNTTPNTHPDGVERHGLALLVPHHRRARHRHRGRLEVDGVVHPAAVAALLAAAAAGARKGGGEGRHAPGGPSVAALLVGACIYVRGASESVPSRSVDRLRVVGGGVFRFLVVSRSPSVPTRVAAGRFCCCHHHHTSREGHHWWVQRTAARGQNLNGLVGPKKASTTAGGRSASFATTDRFE